MSLSPFQNKGHKPEHMYQYIYADIVGHFPTRTPEGYEYSLTLIDKFSNESEVEEFLEFVIKTIHKKGGKVNFEFFVPHQGGEIMSTVFKKFLKKWGI